MKPTLNEKFIAYLTLLSGLSLSAVAVYYSVVGLTAIFSAAVIPIIIMGTTLEISKLVATVWLKQNWKTATLLIKTYLFIAIIVLMIITSMGIFGFLSKAHSDQNLVSGDVISKIAVYDEKIKTEKENIEANRKALKQMDEGVDQVLGRSTDEKGADKAVALRKTQQKERVRLQDEISQSQKSIAELNDARAPIAAEVRKVEAEVGPIKYIAAFFYGSTDETILEKAVTWVIITIIIVFDPLAIILLLASQMSFQEFREREGKPGVLKDSDGTIIGLRMPKKEVASDEVFEDGYKTPWDNWPVEPVTVPTTTISTPEPKIKKTRKSKIEPIVEPTEEPIVVEPIKEVVVNQPPGVNIDWNAIPPNQEYIEINGERMAIKAAKDIYGPKHLVSNYVQNEEQKESGKWNKVINEQENRLK